MALFKVYHGTSGMPDSVNDSYGYVVVKDTAQETAGQWEDSQQQVHDYGVGEWYIDAGNVRYRLAAAELIDEYGQTYTLDDLVLQGNLVDSLVDKVYNESTRQSKLTMIEQEKMQIAFNVAKAEDSISEALLVTVPAGSAGANWILDTSTGNYKNTVTISTPLHCGNTGAIIPVPPLVVWDGNSATRQAFDSLVGAIVDENVNHEKVILTFFVAPENRYVVTAGNFNVIIIDHR